MLYDTEKMSSCGPSVMAVRCDTETCADFESQVHQNIGEITQTESIELLRKYINVGCRTCGVNLLTPAEHRYATICIERFGTDEELARLIKLGMDSGYSELSIDDIMAEAKRRVGDPNYPKYDKCDIRDNTSEEK